jgi:MFS family permease
MEASVITERTSAVDRRLAATKMQIETAIAIVGGLILIVVDAWGLALIPLVADLEKAYTLTPSQAAWALATPSLVGAGFVPTVARLGDRFGMRGLVLASVAIGLVGNVVCAVAPGFGLLMFGRAILGLSAALPLMYAILRARGTSAARVTKGVSILTAFAGAAVGIGWLLAGLIIQTGGSVRTVFWVIAVLAAVSLVFAWLFLPEAPSRSEPIDWIGAVGVCLGLVGVVLAITEGNTWGWSSARVLGSLIGGLAILVVWAFYETRQSHPLINLRRVANRNAAPSFLVLGLLGSVAIYGNLAQSTYVELPKVTGYGLGLTVLQSSLILCVLAVTIMIGGIFANPLINRFGPRPVMVASSAILAANFIWLAFSHSEVWQFIVFSIIWGCYGLVYSGAYAAWQHDAKPDEAAMYTSANTVVVFGFGGLGPALFTVLLTSRFIPHTPIPDPVVFKEIWIYGAIGYAVIALLSLFVQRTRFVPAEIPAGPIE